VKDERKGETMSDLDRIHDLMDELAEAVQKLYPDMTYASVILDSNDCMSISVVRWDDAEGRRYEDIPRKVLLDQSRCALGWTEDESKIRNDYLLRLGVLSKGA
jgi:hypothetical protein